MDFDFTNLAIVLGTISLGGIGALMAGYFFFPEIAEKYKRQIPTVIVGILLTMVSAVIIDSIGG
jgi:glucose uptake protein GlcU